MGANGRRLQRTPLITLRVWEINFKDCVLITVRQFIPHILGLISPPINHWDRFSTHRGSLLFACTCMVRTTALIVYDRMTLWGEHLMKICSVRVVLCVCVLCCSVYGYGGEINSRNWQQHRSCHLDWCRIKLSFTAWCSLFISWQRIHQSTRNSVHHCLFSQTRWFVLFFSIVPLHWLVCIRKNWVNNMSKCYYDWNLGCFC